MRATAVTSKKLNYFFIVVAVVAGVLCDYYGNNRLDFWIHDLAIVHQAREEWKYTAVVVLDEDVPYMVGRKQSLPLFALATERLVAAGAAAVFLDARISKEIESRMPYAQCIEKNGEVRWSMPQCTVQNERQCFVNNSAVGNAPLKMTRRAIQKFYLAPYFAEGSELPDFLLYDWDAAEAIPPEGLVVSDRLVTAWSPVARWVDLSDDSAVYKLASLVKPEAVPRHFHATGDRVCEYGYRCRRVRLSKPINHVSIKSGRMVMPVSRLASCDADSGMRLAALVKDRAVILQTTSPTEQTDRFISPMTTAFFGPRMLTPGSQYIADEVETVLNLDHPREPEIVVKLALFVLTAVASVTASASRPVWLWFAGPTLFLLLVALCLFNPLVQLWPLFATMLVFVTGAGQAMTVNLIVGLKEGRLIKQYMPRQIHNLLFSLREGDSFQNKRCRAVVLISDLAGYTTLTGLLKEPGLILNLMNDYLSETAIVLQDKYNGWFETYIGDMVCYYWPYDDRETFHDAVAGAVELAQLQKKFFAGLQRRYRNKLDEDVIRQINHIINAGIGLTVGDVVMGNLGPKRGVRKFGILGDPLNLACRVESLTRLFNTEIIVTGDFLDVIKEKRLPWRRLGLIKVKGRIKPEMLYALGSDSHSDPRFGSDNLERWERWLQQVERGGASDLDCPKIYSKDKETILAWKERNLLRDKVWYLDSK